MNRQPIGIFDSGIGGTSIWKELQALLPKEHTIYLADSINAPYGEKSKNEIIGLSRKNTEYLLKKGCKLIVVACNTATTNAIDQLRNSYDIPFIGIEPAIKPAALKSQTKSIGILATKGTLSSHLFHSTSENHANSIHIVEREGTGLVPLIEQGKLDAKETIDLLKTYLEPMLESGMDHLVLGCTHYPFLIPTLKKILPPHIRIIDSGEAVARQTKNVLQKHGLLNTQKLSGSHQFFSNADCTILKRLLSDAGVGVEVSYLDF